MASKASKMPPNKKVSSPGKSLFWADQIARGTKEHCSKDPKLKAIVKKQGYLVYDEKTPSGKIHVGSGRGWIIHDAIAKAMRDSGMKGVFALSSDDIDPFDKMNNDLPKGYSKYLGIPFRDMPSPVKGYKSFADYYFMQCVEMFEDFGIEARIESTGEQYDRGVFNQSIKAVLNNAAKIQAIYQRIYGKYDASKLPFNPICGKCGKIGTTQAYEWDPEREVVKYRCLPDLVSWAKGCGHEGETSPYNGKGKLPWKIEWAAKWASKGVVCELAGKDHFTLGGSRTVSIAISDEIFDFPPPYPSTRTSTGSGYEFFNIGGRKMSTSKGQGIGFVDSVKFAPAKMIRYMLVRTRPKTALDFDPSKDNDIILLYDRYDTTEKVYFGKEKAEGHELQNQKRIYELSHVGRIPSKIPPQVPLTYAALGAQISSEPPKRFEMLKESGHLPPKASKEDIEYVKDRLSFAENWVSHFASDQHRISVNNSVPAPIKKKLSPAQKKALRSFASSLSKARTEKQITDACFDAAGENDLKPGRFFQAAYLALISKERGPRLAPFILALGRARVSKLLAKA